MSTSGVSELNFFTSSFFAYILEVHHHFLRKRMERLQKSSHIITVELYVGHIEAKSAYTFAHVFLYTKVAFEMLWFSIRTFHCTCIIAVLRATLT